MGGDAIASAERLDAATYAAVVELLTQRLLASQTVQSLSETSTVAEVATHGDVDLIVIPAEGRNKRDVVEALAPLAKQVVTNGHVTSVGIVFNGHVHQVDFNFSTPELYEHTLTYNSAGIFGMGLGLGLRHADSRLVYGNAGLVFRTPELSATGRDFVSLTLSRSNADIFAFLHLDAVRFRAGFATFRDVFDFLLTCPYVDGRALADALLRAAAGMKASAKYLARLSFLHGYDLSTLRPPLPVPDAVAHFGKCGEYDALLEKVRRGRLLRERLNGHWVGKLTGLHGKVLGELMKALKARHTDEEVLAMSPGQVSEAVLREAAVLTAGR